MRDKPFAIFMQHLLPQHGLSRLAGWLARNRWPWLKKILIHYFIHRYDVDFQAAQIENPHDYPSFNALFTRHLKPELRPIASGLNQIACPVDGCISQLGDIKANNLFQAKGFYFDLAALLGSEKNAVLFFEGRFITFYLAPKDYHRVHMPLTGTLIHTHYIPGKLFSVNQQTTCHIENLFSQNERLICLFDTTAGPMAMILVGAMLVGSIKTVWKENEKNISIEKGAELGHFEMGSTVIFLLAKNRATWSSELKENSNVLMGQSIGTLL